MAYPYTHRLERVSALTIEISLFFYFIFAVNSDELGDPQLVKVQRIRDCGHLYHIPPPETQGSWRGAERQ